MSNYYSTINNNILTFTDIVTDSNGFEKVTARFERGKDEPVHIHVCKGKPSANCYATITEG